MRLDCTVGRTGDPDYGALYRDWRREAQRLAMRGFLTHPGASIYFWCAAWVVTPVLSAEPDLVPAPGWTASGTLYTPGTWLARRRQLRGRGWV